MNMAVTAGLELSPPPFAEGLAQWTPGNGLPGSGSYEGAGNVALVAGDGDFGNCLELVKQSNVHRLRSLHRTPFRVGLYLRVRVRLKVLAGVLPGARLSCLPVNAAGAGMGGLASVASEIAFASHGHVVELSAIIGSGPRQGVDLAWGVAPVGLHVGLELTGANGATLRIENFTVEDVTTWFLREMLDVVDVRDHGAMGDGTTDDLAAFVSADAAAVARGARVLVPAGTWRLLGHMTFAAPVRFEGKVSMNGWHRLVLGGNFDLDAYAAAFGSAAEGLRRGLQALFNYSGHAVFDLCGRTVDVHAPIMVAELAGVGGSSFVQRRVIDNGQLSAVEGAAWTAGVTTSQASYSADAPYMLGGVVNVASIEVGSQVSVNGAAREVYVRARDVAAGTLTLSLPLGPVTGTRIFTFTRFRYMIDLSGFGRLDRFELTRTELLCRGQASAVMLPPSGITSRIHGCTFNRPAHRAITSIGTGCQGMMIDECNFLSDEQGSRVQDRISIGLNVNANDVKIRDNRAVRFRHFAVMHGSGHMFVGNHWFQGDAESPGVRTAGVVLKGINVKTLITGNYVDNSFIEMTNEHELSPAMSEQYSFGGLTLTGNIFTANDVVPSFAWIVITPRGAGHFINGLSISGNTFRTLNGTIARAEKVDATWADLDHGRLRNLFVQGNNFNGVSAGFQNPLVMRHEQNSPATTWMVDPGAMLAFGGRVRNVTGLLMDGAARDGAGQVRHDMPWAQGGQGANGRQASISWPVAVRGSAWVTLRVDNPN